MTDKKKFKEPDITISKVYTKTGDSGNTGLVGGQRLSKDDIRIETKRKKERKEFWDCDYGS